MEAERMKQVTFEDKITRKAIDNWQFAMPETLGGIWPPISPACAMQHAKIYRAWLPAVIYSLLFSPFLQQYHISERLLRATKRGKFLGAAWRDQYGEFACGYKA